MKFLGTTKVPDVATAEATLVDAAEIIACECDKLKCRTSVGGLVR